MFWSCWAFDAAGRGARNLLSFLFFSPSGRWFFLSTGEEHTEDRNKTISSTVSPALPLGQSQ